ncbi:MAG: DUF222 domain-containing protein [Actinomycetota bacterium]|nr:DUF222 domain-containing protein [Actinomycetota bacterium]
MFKDVAVEDLIKAVREHDFDPHDDPMGAQRIDAIKAFELVIRAAQAGQAAQIAALDSERAAQMGLGRGDHSLSVIGEVALARNISPWAAGTQYGFAVGLARMPKTAAVLAAGGISEPSARAVVRESTGLDTSQAGRLDNCLSGRLEGLTHRRAGALARHYAIEIDTVAATERAKANRADRFVSLFPDTDGVAVLQIRGPADQLQAAYNALAKAAATAKAAGDARTSGQVMCDEFVQRVTGATKATDLNIEIGLIMTMGNLLDEDDSPCVLPGFGPIPASLASSIIRSGHQSWIRRLYTDPIDHSLTDCDQAHRRFSGSVAKSITIRDQRCRQPGCDSPIKHLDHVIAFHTGGPTARDNGQGLCVRSHTFKHLPGWKVVPDGHDIVWRTPTGHTYRSPRQPVIEFVNQNPGRLRQ